MSDIAMGYHDARRPEAEPFHRVWWGAIFSGALVALAMELVFLTFGLFIGFQMSGGGAHAWSEVWYFVTLFCSLFIGSWVTARLLGNPGRGNGMLHGFVVWALTMFTTAAIAAMLMWDAIRIANSWLQSFVAAVPPSAPPAIAGPNAAAATGDLSTLALVIWGGLLAAIVGSLLGGSVVPKLPNFLAERSRLPEQPHQA
jgi:hypothetical protein